jgi:RHS repeat-associated protein
MLGVLPFNTTRTYNGDGQVVVREANATPQRWIWNGQNILHETDDAGVTTCLYTREPAVYGLLLSRQETSDSYQYLFDALGSTDRLIDASQTPIEHYTYDAFGSLRDNENGIFQPYMWVGRLGYVFANDPGDDFYYVRARNYWPKLGRWVSRDPIGFAGGSWNLYDYVEGNPLIGVDPFGLRCCVCDAGAFYGVSTAILDRTVAFQAYSKLAAVARNSINIESKNIYTIPPLDTGPYNFISADKARQLGFFLFFVDFDVCETNAGDCQLWIDETGSTWNGIQLGKGPRDITEESFVLKDHRVPPIGECNKTIVFVDAPRSEALKRFIRFPFSKKKWSGFSVVTKQTLEIRDASQNGAVVGSFKHVIRVAIDDFGKFSTSVM